MITDRMSTGLGEGSKRYGSRYNASAPEMKHFKCDQCDKEFNKTVSMNPGGRLPIDTVRCPKCGTTNVSLENDLKNNLCAICAQQIDGWKKYADHMKETHSCILNAAAYDCPKCGEKGSVISIGDKDGCLFCGNRFKRTADGIALI